MNPRRCRALRSATANVNRRRHHRFHFDPIFESQHTPEHGLLLRLLEMGLVPGTRVEIKRAGDPVTIGLWGGRTALSAPLAHAVFVEAA